MNEVGKTEDGGEMGRGRRGLEAVIIEICIIYSCCLVSIGDVASSPHCMVEMFSVCISAQILVSVCTCSV